VVFSFTFRKDNKPWRLWRNISLTFMDTVHFGVFLGIGV
jgi:hypothetical protein